MSFLGRLEQTKQYQADPREQMHVLERISRYREGLGTSIVGTSR